MPLISSILHWARSEAAIRSVLLTGSRSRPGTTDFLSDYDLALFGTGFPFLHTDAWLHRVAPYWLCVHDAFTAGSFYIPTRLVLFADGAKADFSFHPLAELAELAVALPDAYNLGYQVLLDKDGLAAQLPPPAQQGFIMSPPDANAFQQNQTEFWFETYQVAKFLARGDLWAAKLRDAAAKNWLLQVLHWCYAVGKPVKQEGRGLQQQVPAAVWQQLHRCFAPFDAAGSWQALDETCVLYRETALQLCGRYGFAYSLQTDTDLTAFINLLRQQALPLQTDIPSQNSRAHPDIPKP